MRKSIMLCALLSIFVSASARAACLDFVEKFVSQASTPTIDVVVGSEIDAKCFSVVSWMFQADHGGAVVVWVYGSNDVDFEDEVRIVAWSTAANRPGSQNEELPRNPVNVYYDAQWFLEHAPATYGYYRVKVQDFPGNSGTLLLNIVAKK